MAELEQADFPITAIQWEKLIQQFNLSPQQARIIEMILVNQSEKQIAEAMGLKIPTIRTYMQRIYLRLSVNDRLGLVLKLLTVCLRNQV